MAIEEHHKIRRAGVFTASTASILEFSHEKRQQMAAGSHRAEVRSITRHSQPTARKTMTSQSSSGRFPRLPVFLDGYLSVSAGQHGQYLGFCTPSPKFTKWRCSIGIVTDFGRICSVHGFQLDDRSPACNPRFFSRNAIGGLALSSRTRRWVRLSDRFVEISVKRERSCTCQRYAAQSVNNE